MSLRVVQANDVTHGQITSRDLVYRHDTGVGRQLFRPNYRRLRDRRMLISCSSNRRSVRWLKRRRCTQMDPSRAESGLSQTRGYVHLKTNACSSVNSQLGAGHDRRPGPVDPVDNDGMRCSAGAAGTVSYLHMLLGWWSCTGSQAGLPT
jgi:hypothetical protein